MLEDQDGGSDVALQLHLKPHAIGFSSSLFLSFTLAFLSLYTKPSGDGRRATGAGAGEPWELLAWNPHVGGRR